MEKNEEIIDIQKSLDNNNTSSKLRKNKLNLLNSINSNLPSRISDSKTKENILNNKIKPKTATNRYQDKKKKSKGKQIKKIKIENNNFENINFLKKNLKQIKTEGDALENIENKITSKKIFQDINNNKKQITDINIINNNKRIFSYKKKNNISSFDKRKKYVVPKISKKKKRTIKKITKKEKNDELEQTMKETKEILTSNLITNKQIEYLKDYQKYID